MVTRPGATVSAEELRAWANHRLGKHQRIAVLEFRAALARNDGGKVIKATLRAPYWPAR